MKDKQGREYLRLDQAKHGIEVELDKGFTCAVAGPATLCAGKHGLFFPCEDGEHYISGQADDGIHCVGIYPAK